MIYPKRIFAWAFALILSWAAAAGAQTTVSMTPTQFPAADPNDPNWWPATFDGVNAMGPYAWVDGPTYLQKDPSLTNAVRAGHQTVPGSQNLRLYVARARQSDGVHPGKFYNGTCSIGWGGKEVLLTSGYELLVNTRPDLAQFLPRTWVGPETPADRTFTGGSAGTAPLRVCRASYNDGVHPGKEWAGKCFMGFGGQEVAVAPYEVLSLGFDKAGWQAAQAPQTTTQTGTTTPTATLSGPNNPNTWPATFDGVNAMGPYAWVDGPAALQKDPNLTNAVIGGREGGNRFAICRARMSDGGVHPGHAWDTSKNRCRVGWGGVEVVLTEGFEFLVNTQPSYAKFLTQTWTYAKPIDGQPADPSTTFKGGSIGGTQMRVCQYSYGQLFPGKEWAGKCNIGFSGKEIAGDNYQVLTLGFDRAAWQAAGSPITMDLNLPSFTLPTVNIDQGSTPVQIKIVKTLSNVSIVRLKNSPETCVALDIQPTSENQKPGVARPLAKEGTGLRMVYWNPPASGGLPTCATAIPFTWFVRENVPGQAGWFRLKWFDTNLCLDAASNTDGAAVRLATCNGSVNQSWTFGHATTSGNLDALKSALQVDNNSLISAINPYGNNLLLSSKDGNLVLSGQSYLPVIIDQFPEWKYQEDMIGGGPPK